MSGSYQDKDGDGKVAWYPDPAMPNETPPAGQDKSKVEATTEDTPAPGSVPAAGAPILFTSTKSNPSASLSSKGETDAEINNAFGNIFGQQVPKEIANAFYNELKALQASRTTKPVTKGGIDYQTQGVSAQERKDILNRYIKQYATDKIALASLCNTDAQAVLQRGSFGVVMTRLKTAYNDNGISFNPKSLADAALESSLNPERLESNLNLIKIQAKTMFPAISDKIDAGYSVKQVLSPYLSSRANILEDDVDAIDLKELQTVANNPKGLMGLYEYEISLRKNPKWTFTKNALDTLGGLARDFTKTFGAAG